MRVKPKKYLGQNFLNDKNTQLKIVAACGFSQNDVVLEIGSGRGDFARLIAPLVRTLYALEIDKDLILRLENDLQAHSNIEIIQGDILKFDVASLCFGGISQIKIFGNIPYYITTPILEHLFQYKKYISEVYLTVQKEFAQRMVALPGKKDFGSLSCFVQYHSTPEILFNIKRTCFWPAPKVDSSFVRIRFHNNFALSCAQEDMLFWLTKNAFSQRRKTLKNSLKGKVDQAVLERFFAEQKIKEKLRPEELSLLQFVALAKIIKNN